MKSFIINSKHGNFEVLVDNEDYDRVKKHGWCVSKTGPTSYIRVECTINYKRVRLHRFILNITDSKEHVDHIDGNTLNNQKSNLRLCNHKQNMRNTKSPGNKTSYLGVWKDGNRYRACISINNKTHNIKGKFKDALEAAIARDKYAIEIGGEFSKLNFSKKKGEACD